MKKIIAALAITVLFAACTQTTEPVEEVKVIKTAVTANAEMDMKIEGMTCVMGCKNAIEKTMNDAKGVAECNV